MRHIGINPREYTVVFDFILEGEQDREYRIHLYKDDGTTDVSVYNMYRVINKAQGGRDVATFNGQTSITLNQNDLVYWRVENESNDKDCTLELDSAWSVKER